MCTLSLCWFVWCFLVVFLGLWVCRRKTAEGNCPSHHILSGLFSQHTPPVPLVTWRGVSVRCHHWGVPLSPPIYPVLPGEGTHTCGPHLRRVWSPSQRAEHLHTYLQILSHRFVSSPHSCIYSAIFISVWTHGYLSLHCVFIWGLPCCLFCCSSYSSLRLGNSFTLYPF